MSAVLEFAGPAADELFSWLDGTKKPPHEVLIEGPAGTGKTRLVLEFIRSYVEENDGVRVLMMRDHRVDMSDSVLVEWEDEVLGPDHPAVINGPTRAGRRSYVFPNGSEVVLGGLNNEGKLFSSQYHGIYFNECWQTNEKKWETLHRALRAKGGPFRFFIGDTNPRHKGHWLNQRCDAGKTLRIKTRLWHNPRFFREGVWQPDGIEYATRQREMYSGTNYTNLYLGEWDTPTGAVWPEFDADRHLIHAELFQSALGVWHVRREGYEPIELRWFVLSFDMGSASPGCLQAWGVTPDGVMYRVEEYYRRGWDHSEWIARALPMIHKYRPQAMVSDHDMAFIKAMNRALVDAGLNPICRTADKTLGKPGKEGKKTRIEMVRTRWKQGRMILLRGALRERDPSIPRGVPACFEDEIPALVYREHDPSKDSAESVNDPDDRCADHGCDAAMYADAFVWGRSQEQVVPDPTFPAGTAGQVLGHRANVVPSIWEKRS